MEMTSDPKKWYESPFLTIWIKPKQTIREIIDTNPEKHVFAIASLSGVYQFLDNAIDQSLGDNFPLVGILIVALVMGVVYGVVLINVGSALFGWAGKKLGGVAKPIEMKAALAWASVPDILILFIFIPIIFVIGRDWFSSSTVWIDEGGALLVVVLTLLSIVGLIIVIWKAVIFLNCMAEVHQFSLWKSLAASILAFLVIVIPIVIFVFLLRAA